MLTRYLKEKRNPVQTMSTKSKRKNLMIASGEPESMLYPTEKGFFIDGTGEAYMQNGGKFFEAGEYNPDVHGLPVPLVKKGRSKLKIATA